MIHLKRFNELHVFHDKMIKVEDVIYIIQDYVDSGYKFIFNDSDLIPSVSVGDDINEVADDNGKLPFNASFGKHLTLDVYTNVISEDVSYTFNGWSNNDLSIVLKVMSDLKNNSNREDIELVLNEINNDSEMISFTITLISTG